ncbi:hypothetical protein SAMN05518672_102583 [Chitinophaga sp. CF118]|nr:hypothetical protein SAMN05518672_102583 [Chitinophaga sp. CF118]
MSDKLFNILIFNIINIFLTRPNRKIVSFKLQFCLNNLVAQQGNFLQINHEKVRNLSPPARRKGQVVDKITCPFFIFGWSA